MENPHKKTTIGIVNRAPLYQQVKEIILNEIREEKLKGGDRMPTEAEMKERFGVSIGTVRRAMGELEDAGVIERKEGVGTFVRSFRNAGFANSFQLFSDLSGRPRGNRKEVLLVKPTVAPDAVAEALRLPLKSVVLHAVRKLYGPVDGSERFITVDESFLLPDLFEGLDEHYFLKHFRPDDSLYKFFDREFGVVINRQKCRVSYERLDAETAERLQLQEGLEMIKTERLSFDIGRQPVEYRINRGMADCTQVNFEVIG